MFPVPNLNLPYILLVLDKMRKRRNPALTINYITQSIQVSNISAKGIWNEGTMREAHVAKTNFHGRKLANFGKEWSAITNC